MYCCCSSSSEQRWQLNRLQLTTALLYDSAHIILGYAVRMGLEKCLLGVINFSTRESKRSFHRQLVPPFVGRSDAVRWAHFVCVCVCVFLQSFVCFVVLIRSESMMSTMITATCVRYARVQVPASRWLFCWRDTDAGKLNSTGFACIYSQQRQVRLRIDFCCCCCCYINLITKNCFIQRNLISPYFYFSFLHCSTYNCSIQQNLHINLWRYFVCDYKH